MLLQVMRETVVKILVNNFNFFKEHFAVAGANIPQPHPKRSSSLTVKDIVGDGIFWAVPKSRRTVEKRRNRKFGWPQYVWKMIVPKTNILTCSYCGHDYEAGHLCRKFLNLLKNVL